MIVQMRLMFFVLPRKFILHSKDVGSEKGIKTMYIKLGSEGLHHETQRKTF